MDWTIWEPQFIHFLQQQESADAAHDLAHVERVVNNARQLAETESAEMAIVIPAAWLHDCVAVAKDSPLRSQASRMAAEEAVLFLGKIGYPRRHLDAISHAIAAHSFSAAIPPETVEAKIVQDADRLDSLGAIGIARCLMTSVALQRQLYDPDEPFPIDREPDDMVSAVDHFYTKLLTLAGTMQTHAGRVEGEKRTEFMRAYLAQLGEEIGVSAE